MCDLQVCRICLETDKKFYSVNHFELSKCYGNLTGLKICDNDPIPQYFCHNCSMLLYKFNVFKDKCFYSYKVLNELLKKKQINYKAITNIRLKKVCILNQGVLERMIPSKRVQTLNITHTESEITQERSNIEDEALKTEATCNDSNDDDWFGDSVTDPEAIEPKHEDIKTVKSEQIITQANEIETLDSEEETLIKFKRKKQKTTQIKVKRKVNKNKGRLIDLLDPANWRKVTLTEEEAVLEFEARAHDPKYLDATYKCTDCFKGFSKKSMLDSHLPRRHGKNAGNSVCQFCKMRFRLPCHLKHHLLEHYRKFECLRCNLVCTRENSVLFHEEYHNGVIRKCVHCDREFRHSSTFYTHLRTHRSKHMCTLCGESFVNPLGLRYHQRLKHVIKTDSKKKGDEKSIYCAVCQINFQTKDAYDKHLKHSALHTGLDFDPEPTTDEAEDIQGDDKEKKLHKLFKGNSGVVGVVKTLSQERKGGPRENWRKPSTCVHRWS